MSFMSFLQSIKRITHNNNKHVIILSILSSYFDFITLCITTIVIFVKNYVKSFDRLPFLHQFT